MKTQIRNLQEGDKFKTCLTNLHGHVVYQAIQGSGIVVRLNGEEKSLHPDVVVESVEYIQ